MSILLILAGLTLLVVGGEFLVRASVGLSFKLDISKMVIGLTVVSFATSAPELLVSIQAALDGSSDIALGNVIGSNIANIGLVLGITAFITTLSIDRDFYRFNWPAMMLFSIALFFLLYNDGALSATEGGALVLGLIVYLFVLIRRARKQKNVETEEVDDKLATTSYFKIVVWLIIGGAALYWGSEWLVDGAKDLAGSVGISEYAISVTVIAIGTSVPELAASVIAAVKKEKALSLGNLLGSNIFNIASVLGITSMIKPIHKIDPIILQTNIYWMIGFAAIVLPLAFLPKKFELSRYKGLLLVAAYFVFVALALL